MLPRTETNFNQFDIKNVFEHVLSTIKVIQSRISLSCEGCNSSYFLLIRLLSSSLAILDGSTFLVIRSHNIKYHFP